MATTVAGIKFENFERFAGGAGNNRFEVQDNVNVTIDGGEPNGNHELISMGNRDNQWQISDRNGGNLNQAVRFTNIQNLTGNDRNETITFTEQGLLTGNIQGNTGNLTLQGDEINIEGDIAGTGALTITPLSPDQTIAIGDTPGNQPQWLELSPTELNRIQAGFGQITITAIDGNIEFKGNSQEIIFSDPVTITAPMGGIAITNPPGSSLRGEDNATITIAAQQDITLGQITTSGNAIKIVSEDGGVNTLNLTTSSTMKGGDIIVNAPIAISTGNLDSSSAIGDGGKISLDPISDITTGYLNSQGGSQGQGGTIDITTDRFFRADNTFVDQNGVNATISSAGGIANGQIVIRHGGNGETPFIIGDNRVNGTAGAISGGLINNQINTIAPPTAKLFTYTQNNIQIISKDEPIIEPEAPSNPGEVPYPEQEILLLDASPNVPTLYSAPTSVDIATDNVIVAAEESFTNEFEAFTGIKGNPVSPAQARQGLRNIANKTGEKPALLYVRFNPVAVAVNNDRLTPSQKAQIITENPEAFPPEQWQLDENGQLINRGTTQGITPEEVSLNDRLELILITGDGPPIQNKCKPPDGNC
ncbi:MAG: hypothetical protein HC796_01230 [Synechococcaceae cyanobacterium RL_1_2]|nr:hypothetical protein [Synechococcaceae cyanobacterium RL_1_2]